MAVFADPSVGEAVVDRLNASPEFEKQTRWFDGSILLESDEGQYWLKIYRGKVIDHLPFTPPLGYTFKLSGSDRAWQMLANGERHVADLLTPGARYFDDDPEFKTLGQMIPPELKLEGNLMEASRMTEAVHAVAWAYAAVAGKA